LVAAEIVELVQIAELGPLQVVGRRIDKIIYIYHQLLSGTSSKQKITLSAQLNYNLNGNLLQRGLDSSEIASKAGKKGRFLTHTSTLHLNRQLIIASTGRGE
jgi:hypothetical protein